MAIPCEHVKQYILLITIDDLYFFNDIYYLTSIHFSYARGWDAYTTST